VTWSARSAALALSLTALAVVVLHLPFLHLPYFWDELGQFVPAALDILHDGAWIPHSAVPNAHPPGVMAYLALIWRLLGYSIQTTRAAMLLLACCGLVCTGLLASRVSPGRGLFATLAPVCLLAIDPLFFVQSMMAQLDMPAMLFTLVALLLFLSDRQLPAALACTALVLVKETGIILPLVFGLTLLWERRCREAVYYAAPLVALAIWFSALWRTTGHIFGDAGFTQYNIAYSLEPVRATLSFFRRLYFLFVADLRWIGTLAILSAWKSAATFQSRSWRILATFFAAHVLLVSLIGGAELERYLLPVLPLLYIAMTAAWASLVPRWRYVGFALVSCGLIAGSFLNPPYPFPFENNLAMIDFVELHREAARFLESNYPAKTIYTAWPLSGALRNPAFGYVHRALDARETADFHPQSLAALRPGQDGVLVLYSRTWEPAWSVIRWPLAERFLARYYDYEPQISDERLDHFGWMLAGRWSRRGQWISVLARKAP
jgi:hypothetical protein